MSSFDFGSVTLEPDGYVAVALVGDQTYQTVDALCHETLRVVDQLKISQKPLLGLVDLSRQTGFNTGSNKAALESLSKIGYERAALVSNNKLFGELAKAIIKALGKDDQTMFFKTREEAVAWLLMQDPMKG
jgi:hypothetical protein